MASNWAAEDWTRFGSRDPRNGHTVTPCTLEILGQNEPVDMPRQNLMEKGQDQTDMARHPRIPDEQSSELDVDRESSPFALSTINLDEPHGLLRHDQTMWRRRDVYCDSS